MDSSTDESYLFSSLSWPYKAWAEKNSSQENYSSSTSSSQRHMETAEPLPDSGGTSSNDNNNMKDLLIYIVKSFSPNINKRDNTQLIDDMLSIRENGEAHEYKLAKKDTSQNNQVSEDIKNVRQEKTMNNQTSKNVKNKVNGKIQKLKTKKPILKQKRPVISFFDDPTIPSMKNPIEIQNLSHFSMLDCNSSDGNKTICDKAKKNPRSSKSAGKDTYLISSEMSKFTTNNRPRPIEKDQTEIERKITKEISNIRRTLNNQAFTKFDPTTPFEDWDLPSSFNVSSNEENSKVVLLEQPSEEKNEETKAIDDGRECRFGDKNEKDLCLETYWNKTDLNFKFISKVFNILPPSKKILDSFVESAKKNTSSEKKSKSNSNKPNNAIDKVSSLLHSDQKTHVGQQRKSILREAQCSLTQKVNFKTMETQCNFTQKENSDTQFDNELCPDNLTMIKMALSKEITQRFASNGHKDGISIEDFEKLVQEQVTKIINEIRSQKYNVKETTNGDQKNIVNDLRRTILSRSNRIMNGTTRQYTPFSELRKKPSHLSKTHGKENPLYEKPLSRARNLAQKQARSSVTKLDHVSIDYNRALKRFQQNLLKTDSDCSVSNKKYLPQKIRSLHYLHSNRNSSRNHSYRREAKSKPKIRGKSNEEDIRAREMTLKHRRHEVEAKLKNSKKRSRPSKEKKALDQTERIRELAHQKLKRGTKKEIQQNPRVYCQKPEGKTLWSNRSKKDPQIVKQRTKCIEALFDTISSSYCNDEEIESKNKRREQSVPKPVYDRSNNKYDDTNENNRSDGKIKTLSDPPDLRDPSNNPYSIRENLFRSFSIDTKDIILLTTSEENNDHELKDTLQNQEKLENPSIHDRDKRANSIRADAFNKSASSLENDGEVELTLSEKKLIKKMKSRRDEILKLKKKMERKLN